MVIIGARDTPHCPGIDVGRRHNITQSVAAVRRVILGKTGAQKAIKTTLNVKQKFFSKHWFS
jgi:hypothetical protein